MTTTVPRLRARVLDLLDGRSQRWLARRLGRNPAMVSRLLTGARSLDTTRRGLAELARALGTDVADLVAGTEFEGASLDDPESELARVYQERNRLVLLAARLAAAAGIRVGRYVDPEGADPRFAWVVQIDLPAAGQVSFHVDASDSLVASVPVVARSWDGHRREEAVRRLREYVQGPWPECATGAHPRRQEESSP